jgi:hypothetical protein
VFHKPHCASLPNVSGNQSADKIMTTIKYFVSFLLLIGLTSCSYKSNSTDAGQFWYSELQGNSVGHTLLDNHVSTYTINGHFYVHLVKHLPVDQNEYYYGECNINNDTLSFDLHEKRKFSITDIFKSTNEIRAKLVLYNIYFYSSTIPKTVCWKKTPIDSLRH